jgi:hypothetical protein
MLDALKRLFSSKPAAPPKRRHMIELCPDCGVREGELHDLFCTKERCPFCGNQLITCDCISSVLKLSDVEQDALDRYIDDTVPPLSDIMKRWKDALGSKGRVAFEAYRDDPLRAAHRGDLGAIRDFLDDGFTPNWRNEVGYTALMSAARGGQVEMIRFLLSRGADATLADQNGFTALHCAVMQPTNNGAREAICVQALIEAGVQPNVRDGSGGTPLMDAAWFGCVEAARELLLRGADATLVDQKGRTAKDLANSRGHAGVLKLLDEIR